MKPFLLCLFAVAAIADAPVLPDSLTRDIALQQRNILLMQQKLTELVSKADMLCDKNGQRFDATAVACVAKPAASVHDK